jgi:MOSC domain-containing protein
MDARVAWISVAPVKGLAIAQREEVLLEPSGVREDRRFHVIGDDGRLLNGKQLGELMRVAADWDEQTRTLALRFPEGSVADGVVELGEPVTTIFYGRDVEGRLVVGPWADALSSFVGRPLRLVQPVEPNGGLDRGGGAVTLLSTGSLEAMRKAAGANGPVDPRRFRMLFGVEGVRPHEEDSWLGRRVRIGEATALLRGNVGRCIVTSRDPDSGARTLPTLDALAEYRGGVETTEPLPFGVWGEVAEPGRVRLGDAVVPEP